MDIREPNNRAPQPRPSYRRTTPHITQPPIQDDSTRYVTRERYTTLDQTPRRRHMGTATSDPVYMPPLEPDRHRPHGAGAPERSSLHYDRYLQTPKPGRSIFMSAQDRSRRRLKHLLLVLLVVVLVLLVVWFLFLR